MAHTYRHRGWYLPSGDGCSSGQLAVSLAGAAVSVNMLPRPAVAAINSGHAQTACLFRRRPYYSRLIPYLGGTGREPGRQRSVSCPAAIGVPGGPLGARWVSIALHVRGGCASHSGCVRQRIVVGAERFRRVYVKHHSLEGKVVSAMSAHEARH